MIKPHEKSRRERTLKYFTPVSSERPELSKSIVILWGGSRQAEPGEVDPAPRPAVGSGIVGGGLSSGNGAPRVWSSLRGAFALGLTFGLSTLSVVGCTQTGLGTTAGGDWSRYGGDYGNRRFSTLGEIAGDNVGRLVPAYVIQTGIVGPFEATPLVVKGVMYLSTPNDGVIAADAKTGDVLWQRKPISGKFRICCGPVSRGVAVGGGLVIVGQLDAKLVALDAATGKPKWSATVADGKAGYSVTMGGRPDLRG
ncbi:MAG: PQQ-binding-like beta-propeller repeat protein [Vulcanimicrobiaceae bacterium]